ncbi:MAG: DUF58 domain-containing protein [Chloroflexi bacterium]|nr:DUF58 domain-containing protein [Chloroflexota bacterium]MBU1661205.1 DUF58 domain-containing protein [Chloroflexota bacterium]
MSSIERQSTQFLFDEAFLRKLERLSVMSRRTMSGQLQGERRSTKRGQSVEFADFRPYSPGDDFRRIDWNAYARLEKFFLKLFVEEEDLTVHILVDASRSMDWGQPNKLEYTLRAAGALGYIALAGLDRVTVTVLGRGEGGKGRRGERESGGIDYFAPHRGKQSANALFTFLENLRNLEFINEKSSNLQSPISNQLRSYAARAQSPGPLILISDLFEPPTTNLPITNLPITNLPIYQSLNTLASKGFEVTLLHTLSPDEVDPDLTGDLKLLDCETHAEIEITADYDLLQRYRTGLSEWQAEFRHFCGARGMHYVPVETSVPLDELLFAWMRRYSVIK